jgi:hypothetical protein
LEILPTCNLAQLADAPLLRLWNFRSDDIAEISKHEKGKTCFQKKKTRERKKIDKQFQGHTHVQESSTAALMVLTAWCNIPTDFTSGGLSFSPQFCDVT